MTVDVEDVATDSDLEDLVLGKDNLQALLPDEWKDNETGEKTAKKPRQTVLNIVLNSLKKRRPPILAEELADLSELKMVVCYGALEIVYQGAVDHDASPNLVRAKRMGTKFADELTSLQPSIRAGATASSLSVRFSRG